MADQRTVRGANARPAPDSREWSRRPVLAACLRAAAFLAPVAASLAVTFAASRLLERPSAALPQVQWWLTMLALGTASLLVVDHAARRLLPLAALFRLSLVFPDAAPSRFSVALRSGTVRRLSEAAKRSPAPEGDTVSLTAELARLVGLLHEHDPMTRGHAERVRAYTRLIADEMKLSREDVNRLQWVGLLHDVGKLDVPTSVLNKVGKLTDEEFKVIKRHPAAGQELVEPMRWWLGDWVDAVAHHHERWDGTGYPAGLTGAGISLGGRIVAVADAYDVMTATRSYKPAHDPTWARAELTRCAGSHFDPTVVRAFLSLSIGKLRVAMGPLSWLANLPVLGTVAASPAAGAAATVMAATAVTAGIAAMAPTVPAPPPPFLAATGAEVVALPFDAATEAALASDPAADSGPSHTDTPLWPVPTEDTPHAVEAPIAPSLTASPPISTTPTAPPTTAAPPPVALPAPPPDPPATTAPPQTVPAPTTTSSSTTTVPQPPPPPQAVDDLATVSQSGFVNINVTRNDLDVFGGGLTVDSYTQGAFGGSVTKNGNGTLRYTPPAAFVGVDTFSYWVVDKQGLLAKANVWVTVTP